MGAAITLRSDYETVRERFSALRMIAQNRDNPLILLDIWHGQPSIGFEAPRGDFRPHVSMDYRGTAAG